MKQTGLTFVLRVKSGAVAALKQALEHIDARIRAEREAFGRRHPRLHYTSFLLLERDGKPNDPVDLVWEVNCDGPGKAFVKHFCQSERELLGQLFQHCEGGPGADAEPASLQRFLRGKDRGWNAFYVAFPGKSVSEIKDEARLRDFVRDYLDTVRLPVSRSQPTASLSVRAELYLSLKRRLATHPDFAFLREEPPERPWSLKDVPVGRYARSAAAGLGLVAGYGAITDHPLLWKSVAVLGGSLAGLLVPLGLAVAWVGKEVVAHETTDPAEDILWDPAQIEAVTIGEDDSVYGEQNHLTHLTKLRPGAFRKYLAKSVFWAVNLLGRVYFNQGDLGGIPTIHFARWTVLDDGWVVFMSNYDGSWASYLGDFVDRAAEGLSAVWSNTHDYPQTALLMFGGARDEERFLSFGRNHQGRNWVWYSAYPELSVSNILNNAALRRELGRIPMAPPDGPMNAEERAFWLPLNEAQLDTFLRRA